jgi:hypothetical protein
MQLRENVSEFINEYGTNLFKSKFDSLSMIETKHTLTAGNYSKLLELGKSTDSFCKLLDSI